MVCLRSNAFESKIVIRNQFLSLNMNISDSLRGADGMVLELHRVAAIISMWGE